MGLDAALDAAVADGLTGVVAVAAGPGPRWEGASGVADVKTGEALRGLPIRDLLFDERSVPSRGSPIAWKTSQPVRCGPSTFQSCRASSLLSTKSPLRVPTRTATPMRQIP